MQEARRLMALPGILAIIGALLTAAVSFAILVGATPITPDRTTTLWLIGLNALFIFFLVALVAREARRIIMARRVGKAASRLHVRIVLMFALVAAVPAILVAIIAAITLNIGLDRWFEIRTKTIINSSLSIAEAYVQENARNLQGTTLSMAYDLDSSRTLYGLDRGGFLDLMNKEAIGRGLAHAALVKEDGSFVMSAKTGADFPMPGPPDGAVKQAVDGKPLLIEPRTRNIMGAIIKLKEIEGLYLYTIRVVDPEVIRAREIVRANTAEYRGLETNRGFSQVAFALPYMSLTLIVILSAIWTGIAVADRLVRPIRQLIGAADEVATGNLDVSVPVRNSDGDVAHLGDTFNKMLLELKSQRNEILTAKDLADERLRFSEAVLAGVTSGVVGVDPFGTITIVNKSAEAMLAMSSETALGQNLSAVLPHVGRVLEIGRKSGKPVYREQVTFFRAGSERTFNVQVTIEEDQDDAYEGEKSYVVTVDDITDLVTAQRTSAWADVARRIAHEIKNPLTPIQLSAERIKRKFGKVITDDKQIFEQCTDTIVRQVEDIRRMVDEFSRFARMPKPVIEGEDVADTVRQAVFLMRVGHPELDLTAEIKEEPLRAQFDRRLISQALTNIIKNAAEAIEAVPPEELGKGRIDVTAFSENGQIVIDVVDNGIGLPTSNRSRLLEPYVTTREKGTGLGLAIVGKVLEDHGGGIELGDASSIKPGQRGAWMRLRFAISGQKPDAGSGEAKASSDKETKIEAVTGS